MTDRTPRNWLHWLNLHRARVAVLVFGAIVPLLLFAEFAEDVVEHERFGFDEPVMHALHALESGPANGLMTALSFFGMTGGVVPLAIGLGVWFAYRRDWARLQYWIASIGGAALLNVAAKLTFARERPSIWQSIAPESTYSFPSGHAVVSMATMAALVVLTWRTRWRLPIAAVALVFVFGVGVSRVYLGVHYPSDILAGWVASLAWVVGVTTMFWDRIEATRLSISAAKSAADA